jgi:hypothetical protein
VLCRRPLAVCRAVCRCVPGCNLADEDDNASDGDEPGPAEPATVEQLKDASQSLFGKVRGHAVVPGSPDARRACAVQVLLRLQQTNNLSKEDYEKVTHELEQEGKLFAPAPRDRSESRGQAGASGQRTDGVPRIVQHKRRNIVPQHEDAAV